MYIYKDTHMRRSRRGELVNILKCIRKLLFTREIIVDIVARAEVSLSTFSKVTI